MNVKKLMSIGVLLSITLFTAFTYAQEGTQIQIDVNGIAENLCMISDRGGNGNTGVFVYDEGVLLIDTKTALLSQKLISAVRKITDNPIREVIITHWHFDHVGGNEAMKKIGATIIANENVRKRMSAEQYMEFFDMRVAPASKLALPTVTFTKDMTLYLGDEAVYVFQLRAGHTDGDAVVYFRKANVIHMGDLYFSGSYPYIGISSGGSVDNMIDVLNQVASMINDETKVIPGHGPLSTKVKLKEYVAMLITIRDDIKQQIKQGKQLPDILASKPTKAFDATWGKGFLTPDKFCELVCRDLIRHCQR